MSLRIRIIACLCILSVLVSLIFLSNALENVTHDPEYTEYNEGIATTTGYYFMENWNRLGRLYLINNMGDVLYMTNSGPVEMSVIDNIEVANDNVYAIYSSSYEYVKDIYKVYRIATYTPYLELTGASDPFVLDADEDVSSIDVIDDNIYVTTVGTDGKTVNVYQFDHSILVDVNDGIKDIKDLFDTDEYVKSLGKQMSVAYRESEGGQYFAEAYYDGNEIVILQDKDQEKGRFAPDVRVKSAVDMMHFNIAQQLSLYSNYLAWWIGGLAIWFIIMTLLMILLRRRNRSLYAFVITEAFYLILLSAAILFVKNQYQRSETRQNVRYAVLAMRQELDYMPTLGKQNFDDPGFYDSDSFRSITNDLRIYTASGYNKNIFYDMFIMNTRTGGILVDAKGHARESASFNYGGALTEVQTELKNHSTAGYATFRINDVGMVAVGIPDVDPSSGYSIVSICYAESGSYDLWNDGKSVWLLFAGLFLIGSLLIAFVYYLQSLDLQNFEHAIRDVALERTKIDVPDVPSEDLKSMWNSLSEITKKMEEINYDKFRIFEAYYRFAPKNIETIMGKDSIFDVKNGDTTNVEGTLMLLTSPGEGSGEKKVKSLTNIMSYMSRFSETQEGILVSQDSSLSILRFFFLKEYNETVSGATQFLHRNSSDEEAEFVSGLLYNESFLYGVAGVKAQSLCFITSPHTKELEEYASWFSSMRIPLVATEDVIEREDAGQVRYIGFITVKNCDHKEKLYEVIDAETARLRQLKLMTRDKFEETIKLFYSKEFYLARNQFSEILKECPEDRLAKWYLFECERYLNGEAEPTDTGELRITG